MRRLIIIEGLPCAGKSTVGRFIADLLGWRYVDEGSGKHPADYEFHAWLAPDALDGFPEAERQAILAAAAPACGSWVVPLTGFEGALFDRLLAHKIYDFLPWEAEKPVMLDRWRTFAAGVGPDEGWVFNCVLLQNPMCETMMRFGFDVETSAAYIGEICRIIRPLEPLVVYLRRDDIRAAIEAALPERGQDWLDGVVAYHCEGAYGRARGLSGFDGYIAALEERQRRELEILRGLPLESLVLDNPGRDWAAARRTLAARLQKEA